jgi:hypothetical protein
MRDILALFASEADTSVLDAGVDLARAHNARLTVAVPVREASAFVHMTPFVVMELEEEFEREAESFFAKALKQIPSDVPVTLRSVRARTIGTVLEPSGASIDVLLFRPEAGADFASARLCSKVVAKARKRRLRTLAV